jgi:hypothetical protein
VVGHDAGRLATITGLVRPGNVLLIGGLASAIGCDLMTAIRLAALYRCMVAAWTLGDKEEIEVGDEIDWSALAQRAGEQITPDQVQTCLAGTGRMIDGWYKAHPEKGVGK